ncbi:MAG: hypothetical protein WC755_03395 [Candidatus Woesearchaeota archaeon]|jgi:hypothetical protein
MDELTKNIKSQRKSKMSLKDIIDANVSLGYKKFDVLFRLFLMYSINILIALIIISIVVLSILFCIGYYVNNSYKNTNPDDENLTPYTDRSDFSKFVVDNTNSVTNEKTNIIDVSYITSDKSHVEASSQYYDIPESNFHTLFSLDGYYKGVYFKEEIVDTEDKSLMKLSREMNPNDGAIDGFIVQRINEVDKRNISTFIFVDEDWKRTIFNTKIFYGSKYNKSADFIFNEIKKGIYVTEISDDPLRYTEDYAISSGGIAVGDLTSEIIQSGNVENSTFMRLS